MFIVLCRLVLFVKLSEGLIAGPMPSTTTAFLLDFLHKTHWLPDLNSVTVAHSDVPDALKMCHYCSISGGKQKTPSQIGLGLFGSASV
jgi:hypothetical protein